MPGLMTTAGPFMAKKGTDLSSPSPPSPSPSLLSLSSCVYAGGSKSSKKLLFRLPFPPSSSAHNRQTCQPRKDLTAARQFTDPLLAIDSQKTHLYNCDKAVVLHPSASMLPCSTARSTDGSFCLSSMVHNFIEKEGPSSMAGRDDGYAFSSRQHGSKSSLGEADMLQVLVTPSSEVERRLTQEVSKILDAADMDSSSVYENGKANFKSRSEYLRTVVVNRLRFSGYNAALCRSRWDHSVGIQAGDYEYIDVMMEQANGKMERLIVELEWKAQFEIARPSNHYSDLLQLLPSLLVGTLDKVLTLVDILTKAATKSLKKEGLDLPPWRRSSYMRSKWSSSYNRITPNDCQLSSYSKNGVKSGKDIRSVGSAFHDNELVEANKFYDWESIYDEAKLAWPKVMYGGPYEDVLIHNKGLGANMRGVDRLTVLVTDWQLPLVDPRPTHKPPNGAGLAAVLMRSH